MNRLLLLLAALVALSGLAGAEIRQELREAEDLSVGDRFLFLIKADVPLKGVVIPDSLENFHVLSQRRVKRPGQDAWLELTLVPLLPGGQSFPKLPVQLEQPDGKEYSTERFRIYIVPVRAEQDSTLVDIKPVEKYRWQLPAWAYPLLALALALLAIVIFFLRRQREEEPSKPQAAAPAAPVTPLPAWKVALNQLEALDAQQLLEKGEHIRYHFQLSQILRQFLEAKYRFPALEMTTSEIAQSAQCARIGQRAEVLRCLRYCDRVKFAKYLPAPAEVDNVRLWLRGWLQSFEVADVHQIMASRRASHAEVR